MRFGLSKKALNTIDSILSAYPGIRQALIYGSRAKGNYRSGSDIDLSFKTDASFSRRDLLRIGVNFDDSDLPYFVDVSVYDAISNPGLKAHIDRAGKLLYSRTGELS